MKVILMVYSEKRNKRFGYVFSTKRKNRQKLLDDIVEVCKEEDLKLLNVDVAGWNIPVIFSLGGK